MNPIRSNNAPLVLFKLILLFGIGLFLLHMGVPTQNVSAGDGLHIPASCFNLELLDDPARLGEDVAVWKDHPNIPIIECLPSNNNFSSYDRVTFWMHSASASNARFTVQFLSDNVDTEAQDYYMTQIVANWEGWRQIDLTLGDLGAVRTPVGWHEIDKIRIHAAGWNATPQREFELQFSGLRFLSTDSGEGQSADGVDLIVNGSFEMINPGDGPYGFAAKVEGNVQLRIDDSVARSGNRSLLIAGDGRSRGSVQALVPVEGGRSYQFNVWYRTPNVEREDLGPRHVLGRLIAFNTSTIRAEEDKVPWSIDWVHGESGSWYEVAGSNFHVTPGPQSEGDMWHPLSVTFTVPENVVSLGVELFNWQGEGPVWFDDLSLKPVSGEQLSELDKDIGDYQIIGNLKLGHPRVLATSSDFDRIRNLLVNGDMQAVEWFTLLKRRADQILSEPPSTYEIPDGLRLLATSQTVVERVETLAMIYQLVGGQRYLDRVWAELEAAARFPDWNPRHFLDTAEMTRAFAIGYDWLYAEWLPEQRTLLREALIEKGLEPALAAYRGTAPEQWRAWVRAVSNWNIIVNGGISMGALAVADEVPDLAEAILRSAIQSIPRALRRFEPDGGWEEGLSYWTYSMRYIVPFLSALETAVGTDFGLGDLDGLEEAGAFPLYLTGPAGHSFNFGDASVGPVRAPETLWLARRYDKPEYAWWYQQYAGSSLPHRNLLWHRPGFTEEVRVEDIQLDAYFRGVEVVTFRSDWENHNASFVGFKAGSNTNGHGDRDIGTFVFDSLGVRWAEDLGNDNYNLDGYFDTFGQRWTYYRNRTEGQNTLLINPDSGPGQLAAFAPMILYSANDGEARAVADLTPAYVEHATKVHRGIALFDDRNQLLIQDEVIMKSPSELWWMMHTTAGIKLGMDGKSALLEKDGKSLWARILSPEEASFHVMPPRPLPDSPNPAGQHGNNGIQKLTIQLEDVTDVQLVVVLTPEKGPRWTPIVPKVLPLSSWRQASDKSPLWSRSHEVSLGLPALETGSTLHGAVPFSVEITDLQEDEIDLVQRVRVFVDEILSFKTGNIQDVFILDTLELGDGAYWIRAEVEMVDGTVFNKAIEIYVENWWQLTDRIDPPIDSGWLGVIDRSQTIDESAGWKYVTDHSSDAFDDTGRLTRIGNTTEYLAWESPMLREFHIVLYAPTDEIQPALAIRGLVGEEDWVSLCYRTAVLDQSNGRYMIEIKGSVPVNVDIRMFRLELWETEDPTLAQIEIGEVRLTGSK